MIGDDDNASLLPTVWCNHSFIIVFFVLVLGGNLNSRWSGCCCDGSNGPTAASINRQAELSDNALLLPIFAGVEMAGVSIVSAVSSVGDATLQWAASDISIPAAATVSTPVLSAAATGTFIRLFSGYWCSSWSSPASAASLSASASSPYSAAYGCEPCNECT